jgi:hypothetical protein
MNYRYTELGMLLGLIFGSGLAVVLFAATGNAVYWAASGVGLALGLGVGAALDRARRSREEPK